MKMFILFSFRNSMKMELRMLQYIFISYFVVITFNETSFYHVNF